MTRRLLVPATCFAPGTPDHVVESYATRQLWTTLSSLQSTPTTRHQYDDGERWTRTATDGCCLEEGEPTTLTWSVVPDGTPIQGWNGEPSSPSNLRSFLNSVYGSESTWRSIIQSVFDRWGELSGVTYVFEPADDGASLTQASMPAGVLGVRGDVRISGHTIDGNSGVLAYNFFPNFGDMVLDTADGTLANTANDSRILRNVLAHEHGHGLGISHVCPVNQTKLMEPFLSTAFDGPQHDDILAVNRGYGDDREDDDALGTARPASLSNGSATIDNVSLDDTSDVDFFSFSVGSSASVTARVTPVGSSYLSGPQQSGGSCSAGTTLNSRRQLDLELEILATDGSLIESTDASGLGAAELLENVGLSGSGTYFAVVRGSGGAVAQLYRLELDVSGALPPEQHSLTVERLGSGSGTVTSDPAGIQCGSDCSQSYDEGATVTLTATPASGSEFAGWSGSSACPSVTMNGDRTCRATFQLTSSPTHVLTVSRTGSGSGTVTSSPSGISCGSTCSAAFAEDTNVVLTPSPSSGSLFVGWSGDAECQGGEVRMSAARSCTARFDTATTTVRLGITFGGNGRGRIVSHPSAINCHRDSGGTCSGSFARGDEVLLEAVPDAGYVFDRWRGDAQCAPRFTISSATSCKAFFRRARQGKIYEDGFESGDDGNWNGNGKGNK